MKDDFADDNFCKTCSLLEAVSYIAFGTTQRKPARFYAENKEKMEEAEQDLRISIQMGHVRAYGTSNNNNKELIEVLGKVDLDIYGSTWNSTFTTIYGSVVGRSYINVCIDYDDLQQEFKQEKCLQPHLDTKYTTPYIDIIFEVIKSQKITKDNQCKVENLRNVIKQEMEERGLPSSDKICSAMATIIRLPESQKGRQKKKN